MTINDDWDELCQKHHAANKAHSDAIGKVTSKFSAIVHGTSSDNPSTDELSEMDITWEELKRIRDEMMAFVGAHT